MGKFYAPGYPTHYNIHIDGSSIQTTIDGKQAVVANVSETEVGYLDGVTSSIQTQLNTREPLFTALDPLPRGFDLSDPQKSIPLD